MKLVKVRVWNFYLFKHVLVVLLRGLLKQNCGPIYKLEYFQKNYQIECNYIQLEDDEVKGA